VERAGSFGKMIHNPKELVDTFRAWGHPYTSKGHCPGELLPVPGYVAPSRLTSIPLKTCVLQRFQSSLKRRANPSLQGIADYLWRTTHCYSSFNGQRPATFPNDESGLGECQIANAHIEAGFVPRCRHASSNPEGRATQRLADASYLDGSNGMPCVAHLPGRTELYLLQSDIASNPYCEVRTTVSPLWKVSV
jgi:hypothetical protein